MLLALVIGNAVSTIKHASIARHKLLIVQPLMADDRSPDGEPFIAVDGIGAGIGQRVMLTSDGKFARAAGRDATPVRWTVVGIEDPKAH